MAKTKKTVTYYKDGVKYVVGAYHGPRQEEKTWKAVRGSVSNIGRKAVELCSIGLAVRTHG